MDMALYTRLVWEVKPKTIIEIGSCAGGSAVWMGDMLKNYGIDGRVISIDQAVPSPSYRPENVSFLEGDSSELGRTLTNDLIGSLARPWLVIEDAGHHYGPTLDTLKFFAPLMESGEYIIIEDGNMTEMGTDVRYNGGPARAIKEFLEVQSDNFAIDARYCDQYGRNVTGNPNGYLRKI